MWNKKLLIFLLCLTTAFFQINADILVATAVIQGAVEIIAALEYIYDSYNTVSKYITVFNGKEYEQITEAQEYTNLKSSLDLLGVKLHEIQTEQPDVTSMKMRMFYLQECVNYIESRYEEYIRYSQNRSHYQNVTLKKYYNQMLDENVGPLYKLEHVFVNIIGMGRGSLIDIMERYIEYLQPHRSTTQSRQQYFYNFLNAMLSHQLKGFIILRHALMLQEEFENIDLRTEIHDKKLMAVDRVNKTIDALKKVMNRADRDIWKVDPENHVEGETYIELKNVFQTIFYDAREISDPVGFFSNFVCPSKESKGLTPKPINTLLGEGIKQRSCSNVVDCTEINRPLDVCFLKKQDKGPRYAYVKEYQGDRLYPFSHYEPCNDTFRLVETKRHTPGFYVTFEYCKCICDEQKDSDRFISLKPVISDLRNNFVVTGAQFELRNHTLYIKIRQGMLAPNGYIYNNSTWQDVKEASDKVGEFIDEIVLMDEKIESTDEKMYTMYSTGDSSLFYEYNGKQKVKLEWNQNRGLYLDDWELKKNEVVTGVRFAVKENKFDGVSIYLDILATKFNFTSGQLQPETSYWLSTETVAPNRTELKLYEHDSPLKMSEVDNKPDDVPHQFTKFTPSHFLSKDAGQTTLPLIDTQPVFSYPPVPLSGISLDMKLNDRSGGYLILKLRTYNFTSHLA